MRNQDSSTSARGGVHLKRGAIAAAVALCCVIGVGTAVAADVVSVDGTVAPSSSSSTVQTAAAHADGVVQTYAADTPATIDEEDYSSTELVMDFEGCETGDENLQPEMRLRLYPGATVSVDWGDLEEQTRSYSDLTDGTWDITKLEPYYIGGSAGYKYTITITAEYDGEGPAYMLGFGEYDGLERPLFREGSEYLVSVKAASNAAVGENSFSSLAWEPFSKLVSADLSHCNTSGVESMMYMFWGTSALVDLDVSGWDTSSVTSMDYMFNGCSSLTALDVSGWDTSSVTNMYYMFYDCSSLTTLDLSGWDTSSITNMNRMFYNCSALTELDLSDFDTSAVTNMSYLFYGCSSLTTLDVTGFDTSQVTTMPYLFYNCRALTELDLSTWSTAKVTFASNGGNMFYNCTGLQKITLGENVGVTVEASAANDNRLPAPTFTSPYKTTGKWQALIDEGAGTLGEPQDATDITKAIGDSQVTYYAQIAGIDASWFELSSSSVSYTGQSQTPSVQLTSTGKSQTPSIGAQDAEPGYTVSYFDAAGNPINQIVDVGAYSVVITASGNPLTATGNYGGTVTFEFTVTGEVISDDMFSMDTFNKPYTGSPVEPAITSELEQDVDYTVEYKNNVNVGTATVTITGIGNYTGTVTKNFTIAAAWVTADMFTVLHGPFTYTGDAISPYVSGSYNDMTLEENVDYTVAYSNNTNAGTAIITITGMGNYTSECTVDFTIDKAPVSISVADVTTAYGPAIEDLGLSCTVEGLINDEDLGNIACAVEDSANPGVCYPESTVLDAGDYTITATYTDNTNYEVTLTTGALAIEAQTLDFGMFTLDPTGHVYDGSATTVTVTTDLAEGDDYTLTIYDSDGQPYTDDLVNSGTYYFVFSGIGNYTGTVVEVFGIAGRELTDDDFGLNTTEATYTGDPVDVQVVTDLTADTDYELFISHDGELVDINSIVDAGTYTFVFLGINSCEGTITMTLTVNTAAIDDDMFTLEDDFELYTGSAIEPTVTSNLEKDVDYTVEYSDNVNAGAATVTITGIGNYSGTIAKGFTIVKASIASAEFAIEEGPFTYSGTAISPRVSGTYNDMTLEENVDYTVEYSDNTEVGTATVTITGIGNYASECTVDFTIDKAPASIKVADVAAAYGPTIEELGLTYEVEGLIAEGDLGTITCAVVKDEGTGETYDPATVLAMGSYTVTATYSDNTNYEVTLTNGALTIATHTLEDGMFTLNPAEASYTGTAATVAIETALAPDSDYSYVIYDADGNTCSIDALVDVGTYDFVFTGAGNYAGTLTLEFAITAAEIDETMFTIEDGPFTYSGFAIEPTVESTTLEAGTDYKVTYDNNVDVTDEAVVTITGRGNYTGTVTETFTITERELKDEDFSLSTTEATYTGKSVDVQVVTDLAENIDYELSVTYGDEHVSIYGIVNAGTYTFTFEGIGNCEGTITKIFTIGKAAASITVADASATYGPAIQDLDLSYEVEGLIAEGDLGHIVCAVVEDEATGETYDPATVLAVGSYAVTATYTDNTNYEVAVTTGTLIVSEATLTEDMFVVDTSDQTYTGSAIEPTVTSTLQSGDYTVEYSNNTDVGTASITITGQGNCTGTLSYSFTIAPLTAELAWADKNHLDAVVTDGLISYAYDGTASDITATVANLIDGDECTVTVEGGEAKDAGTHMATAVALDNDHYALPAYASCLYYIEHATLAEEMFTVDTDDVTYTGEEICPEVTPVTGLEEGVDYTIAYADNTEVGTASITITGIGDYSGRVVFYFRIVQAVATPDNPPTGLSATYGDTLDQVSLDGFGDDNGSWAWTAEEPAGTYVGDAGESIFTAVYTPTDETDYAPCYVDLTISVAPHTIEGMDFTVENTEQEYTGYAIYASVAGPEDVVTDEPMAEGADFAVNYYKYDEGTGTYGPDAVTPTGVADYAFTISGMGNYTGELTDASYVLTIAKASPSIDLPPANLTATYGDLLEDVILPRSDESDDSWGWSWDEAYFDDEEIDETGHFTHAGTFSYYALFTPEDSVDYEEYDEPLEVTVLPKSVELEWADGTYEDMNRVYDAQASNVAATVSEDSLVNGDEPMDVEVEGGDAKDAGVHMASATALSDTNYTLDGSATATCTYYIEYASAAVVPNDASKTYGGDDPVFDGEVEGLCEGDTLGEISYTRADGEDVGTYAITATVEDANPNYQVTYERGTFSIGRAPIAEMDWTIDEEQAVYSGQPIEKQITAPYDLVKADKPLAEGTDYTCTYFNNTDAGTATLAVTGAGNYTGVWMTTFTIAKATPAYTVPENLTAVYGQALGDVALTDGWTWDDPSALVGDVTEAGKENTFAATFTPTDTDNYETVTGIELTVSVSAKSIVNNEDIVFTVSPAEATYTGSEITVSVFGHDGTTYLESGKDYTVAYYAADESGNKTSDTPLTTLQDVGTYAVVISGTGNYSGEVTLSFKIVEASASSPVTIDENMFSFDNSDVIYTGHAITKEITGSYENTALVEGTDYTVAYTDNIDVGQAKVTIFGLGDYTGTVTLTFNIVAAEITKAMFTVDTDDATYTGEPITKKITSEELAGHDYTVTYENNTEVGTATIKITGVGNYTGELTYTFQIVAAPDTGNPDTGNPDTGNPDTETEPGPVITNPDSGTTGTGGGKTSGSKLTKQTIKAKKTVKAHKGKKAKIKVSGVKTALKVTAKGKAKKALKIKVKKGKITVKAKKKGTFKIQVYAAASSKYAKSNVITVKVKVK